MDTNINHDQRQAESASSSKERSPADGLRATFDRVKPITASDEEIRNAVAEADLPALMATLAMITGDESLIAPELKPTSPPITTVIVPQGGMNAEAQKEARRLAVIALIRYRDEGSQRAAAPSAALIDECVKFLIRGDIDELRPLLEHELGITQDLGEPDWTLPDIAPATAFRVAVIGSGVSGIAAAYRLQQAQVDFTVFEKNNELGGVWWENRYPGCRLDTPNFAYSLSFAQKPDWPQEFSLQPEIHAYLAQVASTAGMRSKIRFGTSVDSMRFDESRATWILEIRQPTGTVVQEEFQAVITAVGILNRPSLPDIPGLAGFQGQVVHSAAWPEGLDLNGKRVALVGTGASAFQIGPAVVDRVDKLKVFQRNPPWLLPTPIYHNDIKPGMLWLLNHVPYYGRWFRFWQFWISIEGRLPLTEVEDDWDHPISVGRANEGLRQGCLESLAQQFSDRPDLLAKMTPTYPPAAKRMLRDNGAWAAMLKSPHVELNTTSISSIRAGGIETSDGVLHDVDVIICATGFKAADFLAPMKITGLKGSDLHDDFWKGDCRAYLGITVPGFPNLFMTGGPNTAVVINGSAIFSSECQVEYSMRAIGHLLRTGQKAMNCREEPFTEYNEWVDQGNLKRAWGAARTSSWYKNSKGRASQTWPFGLLDYWKVTASFNADDYVFLS